MATACVASTSGRVCSSVSRLQTPHYGRRRGRSARHTSRPLAALKPEEKPDWVRELEEHAKVDENVAQLLRGTGGDPTRIQEKMKADMAALHERIMAQTSAGSERAMAVRFQAVDQFDLWVWLELSRPPSPADLELLQEVVDSWFVLGRLGGYNSSNLQVMFQGDSDLAAIEYDAVEGGGMAATMHDMAPLEAKGSWARFWVDLGTADELALDILINALTNFSREQLGIKQLVFGGENDDWELPGDARLARMPEVTMDPMRGPIQLDEEEEEEEEEE